MEETTAPETYAECVAHPDHSFLSGNFGEFFLSHEFSRYRLVFLVSVIAGIAARAGTLTAAPHQ
jgi:hypothetical protein